MSELVIRDRGEPVASPAKSVMPPKAEVVDTRQTGSGSFPASKAHDQYSAEAQSQRPDLLQPVS